MPAARDPFTFAVGLVVILGVIVAVALAIVRIAREKRPAEPASVRASLPADPSGDVPLCMCGAPASRPISRTCTERSWWDHARHEMGFAPRAVRYGFTLATDQPPSLCELHGRAFDAKLRSRLAQEVASEMAKAEERIAVTMAAVESETLLIDLAASMTEAQQRAFKKRTQPAAVKIADVVPINRAANE